MLSCFKVPASQHGLDKVVRARAVWRVYVYRFVEMPRVEIDPGYEGASVQKQIALQPLRRYILEVNFLKFSVVCLVLLKTVFVTVVVTYFVFVLQILMDKIGNAPVGNGRYNLEAGFQSFPNRDDDVLFVLVRFRVVVDLVSVISKLFIFVVNDIASA